MRCPYCDMEVDNAKEYAEHLIDYHRPMMVDFIAGAITRQQEFWAEVCGVVI